MSSPGSPGYYFFCSPIHLAPLYLSVGRLLLCFWDGGKSLVIPSKSRILTAASHCSEPRLTTAVLGVAGDGYPCLGQLFLFFLCFKLKEV